MSFTSHPAVLFGVPIDTCTLQQALHHIGTLVETGRAQASTHQVVTVNVDFAVNAAEQEDVLRVLQHADLTLADGMPLVWASRWLGARLPERVAGADLVPRLPPLAAERNLRVHLFGGAPGVADRARILMTGSHPGAAITADSGPPNIVVDEVDDEIVDSIRRIDPDILCVALGNPKQERFIDTYRERLCCPVMIGIGGSLDLLVGDKRRAPEWARRSGLEWLFRAAQEPRRLGRRYSHDIAVFVPQLIRYTMKVRRYRHADSLHAVRHDDTLVLRSTPARSTRTTSPLLDPDASQLTSIDFTSVEAVAAHDLAFLVAVARAATPASLKFAGLSPALRGCLDDYGVWPLFERCRS